jgi:transcription antitermination factor NusG
MGKQTTVDVKDVKDIKVGDMVKIIDGIIKELTEKVVKSEKPGRPEY